MAKMLVKIMLRKWCSLLRLRHRVQVTMSDEPETSLKQPFRLRMYKTYKDYIKHQCSKLKVMGMASMTKQNARYYTVLRERLVRHNYRWQGKNVLCLGARLGAEVEAFIDIGCFAVGIDVNPGKESHYVVCGDFQGLQYSSESVDIVFTNSFDHAFDLNKMVEEIYRVLKSDGILVAEVVNGYCEGRGLSEVAWESTYWAGISDLVTLLGSKGLQLIEREVIKDPWPGEYIHFTKLPK